jgi:hypothetical protein
MASETKHTLHVADEAFVDKAKTTSRVESDVSTTSSFSNAAVAKMANKITPVLSDYWKKSTVTEADHSASNIAG